MDERSYQEKLGEFHMTKPFHTFITNILREVDGTKEEKLDMYEEIHVHLELTTTRYIEDGIERQKAEQLVMQDFGDSQKIGNELQEAMFPMRKILLLVLSLASIVFSVTIYVTYLFVEKHAEIIWLLLSIGTSSVLLLFALQVFPFLDRRRWINTVLILHLFIYVFGTLLATYMVHFLTPLLTIFGMILCLLSIVLIYRTTMYDFSFYSSKNTKQTKWLHFINITAGILIIGVTLFFVWGILAFSETFPPFLLVIFIPFVFWMIGYFIQMQLIKRNKRKFAYTITTTLCLFIVILVLVLLFM